MNCQNNTKSHRSGKSYPNLSHLHKESTNFVKKKDARLPNWVTLMSAFYSESLEKQERSDIGRRMLFLASVI